MSELPKHWTETSIGEIAVYVQRGKSPKYTDRSDLPVINQKCIRWHGIDKVHVKYIHPDQWCKWGVERYLNEGDVLWNSTGTGTIGRACVYKDSYFKKAVVDSHVTIVRFDRNNINPEYVFYFIASPFVQKKIEEMQSGSTNQVELGRGAIVETYIPLAPFNEQKRIVAKIEELFSELDKGLESLKTARQQLKIYRQAVLKHAFDGKLTANWRKKNGVEGDWKRMPLKDVIEEPKYGTSKKCGYEIHGTGVLRIPNITAGAVDASDLKFAEFAEDEAKQYQLQEGDILTIRSNGSVAIVGQCALISQKDEHFLYAGYLIRLRPKQDLILPRFLLYVLSSHELRVQIENKAKSTSGVNNINSGEIKSLVIPICSIQEQKQIVAILDEQLTELDRTENDIDNHLEKSEALRQSILKRAFSGKLVGQNPKDEPASVLLERIRAEKTGAKKRKNAA